MRSGWLRLTVVIGVAALALVAFGIAMAAAGSSSGLAAVVFAEGKSGTSIEASKTAEGFWTRIITYDWSLTKSVSPDSLTLARGESGEVTYTIAATREKVGEHESAGVRGTICVTNTGGVTTERAWRSPTSWSTRSRLRDHRLHPLPHGDRGRQREAGPSGPGESHCYAVRDPLRPRSRVTQYRNHRHRHHHQSRRATPASPSGRSPRRASPCRIRPRWSRWTNPPR
jgi:hypothetical protein